MYSDPDELEAKIVEFFEKCKEKDEPVTITGLVLHCGFCDRASFYDYEKKPEFTHTIKKARTTIEKVYENALQGNGNTAGAIFALKNFGWTDTQKVDLNANVSKKDQDLSALSDDDLLQLKALQDKIG